MKYIKIYENIRKYKKGDFVTCIKLPNYLSKIADTFIKKYNTYLVINVNSGGTNDIVILDLFTNKRELWDEKYFKKEENFDLETYLNANKYNL